MSDPTENHDWIADSDGNRCSVSYFGSREAAQEALDSLQGCWNCTNCLDCIDCSGCVGCWNCQHSHNCERCVDCSRCYRCSDCSRCSDSQNCSRCSVCYGCLSCQDCSNCRDCQGCSVCSLCSNCSQCARLEGAYNFQDVQDVDRNGVSIPCIENIHQRVYEAASQPGALDMSDWHCGTAHCRAGWVVTLADKAGEALEHLHGTQLAAQLIYRASGPDLPVHPFRFFDPHDDALDDMRRMAEAERGA